MRKPRTPDDDVKMDLTPLIDCVFLMILFFLLTTEITVQVEEVDLPVALEGKQEEKRADVTAPLIINVKRIGTEADPRRGVIVFNGERLEKKELSQKLNREAQYDAAAQPQGRGRGWESGPAGKLSKLEVVVRADRGVRSRYLRDVFTACSDAKIYKLKVSSMLPEMVNVSP